MRGVWPAYERLAARAEERGWAHERDSSDDGFWVLTVEHI
jgi:hypothetical protein